ncbi:MAG: penicillin-binding transpeptidase domain-containing protein [Oscillospiraceae bacterium]|nr:penicillin-binding transpeptidase domain-containing protein [Oscillospiraceae bacterium]
MTTLFNKLNNIARLGIIVSLMVFMVFLGLTRLTKIQIVDADMYTALTMKSYTAQQAIQAARGQVADINGQLLNSNKVVYKVIVQRAFFTRGEENEIIARTLRILKSNDEKWLDSMPITMEAPYEFTDVSDEVLDRFKQNLVLNVDATVENCLSKLIDDYEIDNSYGPEMIRYIAGIRYEMKLRDFSQNNRYTLAEDIALKTVVELKEYSALLRGVDIIQEPMREYRDGDMAAHIRGVVGAITAEQYEDLREKGYVLNDTLGQTGIERAMESVLRGENGVRSITRDSKGNAVSDEVTTAVKPGNSIKLTIDTDFQNALQSILDNHINWLHNIQSTEPNPQWHRGMNANGAAVVVLDTRTGAVLGMANYPSYDLNEYLENYAGVLNAPLNPLYNRATLGVYRPGSSFKTVTGLSGLYHDAVGRYSTVLCTGTYTFFSSYQPRCTGVHGNISLNYALQISCNSYFYEVGRRVGINALADTAELFGVGTNLGLEIDGGGASGRMTTPEIYNLIVEKEFTGGDTIQAAIGQSETLLTPLHLAVQAMTFANNGVRYKPYLVDSVWNYDYSELVYETSPQEAAVFYQERPDAFEATRAGMVSVSEMVYWPPSNPSLWHYDFLPDKVATKTGTPQATLTTYNSTIMGFYPASEPQIAFGIVLENAEWSRYMVRNIIDAYFYDAYEPDMNENGIVIRPWKRWSEEKRQSVSIIR